MRINQRFCGLMACLAMSASACGGEGGEEAVFLYFINGYPGTSAITVTSNRGVIASNIPFGERYGDGESCGPEASCLPSRIDRQNGSDWTVRLESMPQPTEITKDLFSMYPQETGTVVFTQRSGESEVESTLVRHTQTIDSDCGITFINGLAGDSEYLAFASYSFTPEMYIDDPIDQALIADISQDESQTPFISTCGALPTDDPTHENLQRQDVIDRILADPWFFMDCGGGGEEDGGGCLARWGVRSDGGLPALGKAGDFAGVRSSSEYIACIQGAISIRQPEDQVAPQFPGTEPDCPTGELTWADVDVDFQAVQACNSPVGGVALMVEPGQSDTLVSLSDNGYEFTCDRRFRVRAGGGDIIFGPEEGEALGSHGNGAVVESQVEIPAGSQRFWVLLGRPVNPIVWQWDSSETFVDLASYPYFNQEGADGGLRPDIGDNDK